MFCSFHPCICRWRFVICCTFPSSLEFRSLLCILGNFGRKFRVYARKRVCVCACITGVWGCKCTQPRTAVKTSSLPWPLQSDAWDAAHVVQPGEDEHRWAARRKCPWCKMIFSVFYTTVSRWTACFSEPGKSILRWFPSPTFLGSTSASQFIPQIRFIQRNLSKSSANSLSWEILCSKISLLTIKRENNPLANQNEAPAAEIDLSQDSSILPSTARSAFTFLKLLWWTRREPLRQSLAPQECGLLISESVCV